MRRKVIRAFRWSAIGQWGSGLLQFVTLAILARLLGPQAFGLVALASVVIALLQVFVDQGLARALVQRQELEPEHLDTAFWIALGSGAVLYLLTFLSAGAIADFFDEPALQEVVSWLGMVFVVTGLSSVQSAVLERDLRFRSLALRRLIASLVGSVIGIATALSGFGVMSLVWQAVGGAAAGVLTLWGASDWRPRARFSKRCFRDLFSFSMYLIGAKLTTFVNRRADDVIIGRFLGSVALGYYSIAYRLMRTLVTHTTRVTTVVTFPLFSRLQDDPARLMQSYYSAVRYTALISFPLFMGIMLVASDLVPLLYGPGWDTSIVLMQVLAINAILQSIGFFNGNILLAGGRSDLVFRIGLLNAVVSVVAFLIAVRWGLLAVAIAYVARAYLVAPVMLSQIRRVIPIRSIDYLRNLVPPLVAGAIMSGVVALVRESILGQTGHLLSLLGSTLVALVVYPAALYLLFPTTLNSAVRMGSELLSSRKRIRAGGDARGTRSPRGVDAKSLPGEVASRTAQLRDALDE